MKGRITGVNIAYYVNMRTIEAIHQALDIPLSRTLDTNKLNGYRSAGHEEEDGEIVEEEVAMYNDWYLIREILSFQCPENQIRWSFYVNLGIIFHIWAMSWDYGAFHPL